MKNFNYPIVLVALVTAIVLLTNSLSFNPKTGDEKLDEKLNEINMNASMNISEFVDRLSTVYFVEKVMVDELLLTMEPVDVLLTLQISKITDYTIYDVLKSYKNNPENGWNSILNDLGIASTSKEFKQLKNVSSFNDKSFVNSVLSQNKN
jgi:hypothetical protein